MHRVATPSTRPPHPPTSPAHLTPTSTRNTAEVFRASGGKSIEERDLSAGVITFEDKVNYMLENAVAANKVKIHITKNRCHAVC